MHIIFLGTASSYPTAHRGVSCTGIRQEDGKVWIFDCGEGSQIQIQKSSIHPGQITKIFITHLHGDHLFGLPGLMCTLSTQVQQTNIGFTLELFGPEGLRRYIRECLNLSGSTLTYKYIVHELVVAENDDLKQFKFQENTNSLHPQEILGKQIEHANDCWHLFKNDRVTVEAGFLIHRIPSFGFVIKEKPLPGKLNVDILLEKGVKPGPAYGKIKNGESITLPTGEVIKPEDVIGPSIEGRILTILGDTCDSTGMIKIAMNSDLLIHEATFENGLKEMAIEKQHSTPTMAVDFAKTIKARKLILYHFSQRYRNLTETVEKSGTNVSVILKEAQEAIERNNLNCEVDIAFDLYEIELKRRT